MLGDDALGCLKDLRRWLRLYDEKNNRLDVARCLAKANLVNGDLLEILSLWKEGSANEKYWSKISLACREPFSLRSLLLLCSCCAHVLWILTPWRVLL
jgi:replication fork protection complex subunit Tof1/Swi1